MLKHIYSLGLSNAEKKDDEYDEDYLDETLVAAIHGGQEEFIKGLETFLDNFVEDTEK